MRTNKRSHWTMSLKSRDILVVVMDFGGGRCHARQIRHVSTMSFTRANALRGAPAKRKISTSLDAAACQNRMWSLRNVRLTTASSSLCSSRIERRKSNDVHSAEPTGVCVSASTPLGRAGTDRVGSSAASGGLSSRRLSILSSVASSSSSSGGGSTAGFLMGVRAPWGARGSAGAVLGHGSVLLGFGGAAFGKGIVSSSASGAGAPGRNRSGASAGTDRVGSSAAGVEAEAAGSVAGAGAEAELEDAGAEGVVAFGAAAALGAVGVTRPPRRRMPSPVPIRHSPGTSVCLSESGSARSLHPGHCQTSGDI